MGDGAWPRLDAGRDSTPSVLGRPILAVTSTPDNDQILQALRHPLRRRILFVLGEKPRGATIRQVATRLKEPPRRIRHYVELLADAGLVVVEGERHRRGTFERAFRTPRLPFLFVDGWPGGVDSADLKVMLLDILRLAFDSVTGAIAAGTFIDRSGWCAVRDWSEVDAQGWEELAEIHERAARDVVSAIDASAERIANGGGDLIPVISAFFLFEALPWEE